jgi:hypothetical protein
MAKASKDIIRKVTEETTVTLTLSVDEAVTLAMVLANVGGNRETSPRKHAQAVFNALEKTGVGYYQSTAYTLHSGSQSFRPYPSTFKGESLVADNLSARPYSFA